MLDPLLAATYANNCATAKFNWSVQKDTNWTAKIELIPVVLDSGIGSSGEKKDGGATSSMWWMPWLSLQVVCQN